MKEQLQNGLFGYSKQSVHAYLAEMNEDFSQKLLAKEKEGEDTIRALQEELQQLRQENETLRAERREVAGVLIDAKSFAAGMREQAEKADRIQRAKSAELRQAERQRLQILARQIDRLQKSFRSTLERMDEELERHEASCQALWAETEEAAAPAAEEAATQGA